MPRRAPPPARLALAIIDAARSAPSLPAWKHEVLALLAPLGFDVAFLESKGPVPDLVSIGADARVLAAVRPRWSLYERELEPVASEAARRGAATDTEVLGAARERTAYFEELVRPHGGSDSLLAPLVASDGAMLGGLVLGRSGSKFHERDIERVRALVASISVGLAAVLASEERRRGAVPPPVRAQVTRSEADVLALVCLGYTNREIGRGLGRSANTVRNQLVSIFRKVGATTRAELVGLTLHGR